MLVPMDLLVVGSGFFGLTIAERAANAGKKVVVIDRRIHIGGNAYSEAEPGDRIEVHRYGAHLFHTSNETVWEYVNRFTELHELRPQGVLELRGRGLPAADQPRYDQSVLPFRALGPDAARALIAEQAAEFDTKSAAKPGREGHLARSGAPSYEAFIPRLHLQAVADADHESPGAKS